MEFIKDPSEFWESLKEAPQFSEETFRRRLDGEESLIKPNEWERIGGVWFFFCEAFRGANSFRRGENAQVDSNFADIEGAFDKYFSSIADALSRIEGARRIAYRFRNIRNIDEVNILETLQKDVEEFSMNWDGGKDVGNDTAVLAALAEQGGKLDEFKAGQTELAGKVDEQGGKLDAVKTDTAAMAAAIPGIADNAAIAARMTNGINHVSVATAASLCGVSRKTIYNWQQGIGTPDGWPGLYSLDALRPFASNYALQRKAGKKIQKHPERYNPNLARHNPQKQ